MIRCVIGVGLLVSASAAAAESAAKTTNFGIRAVNRGLTVEVAPKAGVRESASVVTWAPASRASVSNAIGNLSAAASIGSQWGRVTSTYRSPEHNRRVGGVRNSFHTHGRAIDIARRPGVSHARIAAAYRNAGYHLIESLDEGDHSHFAFSFGGSRTFARRAAPAQPKRREVTNWGMVTVASAIMR